jgi:hypothetical protein
VIAGPLDALARQPPKLPTIPSSLLARADEVIE